MVSIVAFVGDRGIGREAIDEIMREGDVVALSRRADEADRQPERITRNMDFRAQPAPRPAKALGIRPPLPCGHRRHADERGRWSSRSSAIPDRLRVPERQACRREPPFLSSGSNVASQTHSGRAVRAGHASDRPSEPSTIAHPEIGGCSSEDPLALGATWHKALDAVPLIVSKRVDIHR